MQNDKMFLTLYFKFRSCIQHEWLISRYSIHYRYLDIENKLKYNNNKQYNELFLENIKNSEIY